LNVAYKAGLLEKQVELKEYVERISKRDAFKKSHGEDETFISLSPRVSTKTGE
jgi:hypothetical protein